MLPAPRTSPDTLAGVAVEHIGSVTGEVPFKAVLINPYELGRQPFALAQPAAWLWVRDGTPPPSAPRLDVLPGPPFALQVDEVGNARGGIRTPQLDVPLATVTGLPQSGVPLCALFGTTVPFDDSTLAQRYGTPVDYRAAFDLATDAAVDAGYVRPADALLMKAAAQDVDFGC